MLPKAYEPQEVEKKLVDKWQQAKLFAAHIDPNKKPFVIVIPPPNITGALHMGHALNDTLQCLSAPTVCLGNALFGYRERTTAALPPKT